MYKLNNLRTGVHMNKDYNLSSEEKWEQATLANDFIFYKVMRNHQEESQPPVKRVVCS
jgi:hypothetical protein